MGGELTHLVGVHAEDLVMLDTVLVCPLKGAEWTTGLRLVARVDGDERAVLCDLVRPIRCGTLTRTGELSASDGLRVMRIFPLILAR